MKFTADNWKEYEKQFISFLDSDYAKSTKGIVYFWKTEKPIKRKKGDSRVIYIGESSKSFSERYYPSSNWPIEEGYFDKYYRGYIEDYVSISIEILEVADHVMAEYEALELFKELHDELPPLNWKSGSNKRNIEEIKTIRSIILN
ncbi:MAG: hypothetical protein COA96_15685 [SAR86 cluster bacterium]|uniref:GIY-YIG domain-containing protein n=1 Tax=SAR86 cluster bacterium TaxID=2030880 RepID=A0A2A5ANS7_9GAMM|nr:MAG: hypothetical protein COA96_15685 [SAR86 cluster bacterium]